MRLNNKRSIIRSAVFVGFIAVFGFIIIKSIDAFKDLSISSEENLPTSYVMTVDDSTLIARKYLLDLRVEEVYRNKYRGPISFITYANRYELIICKINIVNDLPLEQIIIDQRKNSMSSVNMTYHNVEHNQFFSFSYLAGPTIPTRRLFLTLAGDSIQERVKNDSILSYHLLCKNVSIRYSDSGPVDIFFSGTEGLLTITKIVPLDLLFLRRGKSLYLTMMAPDKQKDSVPPDLLEKMVMEK